MKNLLLTLLVVTLFNCAEKKKEINSEISKVKKEIKEKKNEVYISVNDTISSFFTNLYTNEMQGKPDIIYLGQKERKTSVIIPTNNSIKIIGGDPFISLFYELKLEKGDSLLIDVEKIKINPSKQVEYPIFKLLNNDKIWSENNFSYLLYKYNIKHKAIVIDNESSFKNSTYDSKKIYQNSIKLLDSLKANRSISNDFYLSHKASQKLKFSTSKLREARIKGTLIEIKDLGISLNDENSLNNNEYINYLRALIHYKYFKKKKRVKNSILFDFIKKNETFLNNNTKQALLNSYLKSIFFVEKVKFKEYLTKFNRINTNDIYKNEWLHLELKQKENSKKFNQTNRNIGVLTNLVNDNKLTFEEVLSKQKGKLVLVDFWASWCSPCRKEMPFLKDIKTTFNTTEFKVIEISIDKDYSAWVRASKMENLSKETDNYIISNWKKSSLYRNYKINTIPRYLLFGKDGKLINENAPRPSEAELIQLIKANL